MKRKGGRPPKNPVEVIALTDEQRREQKYAPGVLKDTRTSKPLPRTGATWANQRGRGTG